MKKKFIFVIALSFIFLIVGCSQNDSIEDITTQSKLAAIDFKYNGELPLEINVGEEVLLKVVARDVNGKEYETDFEWLIDEKIASISNKNNNSIQISGTSPGVTELIAKSEDKSTKIKIKVNPNSNKNIYGYVTNGRGGPAVEDATVRTEDESIKVKTDENGFFQLKLSEDDEKDLIVEKEGFAKTRLQKVKVNEGEKIEFEVPLRSEFNTETWSTVPPEVSIKYSGTDEELQAGDHLKGEVNFNISLKGDNEIYVYYINFSGKQRTPREGFGVEESSTTITVDTNQYNNGQNYLRILAYDTNENAVIYTVPVDISNSPSYPATVPSKIQMIYADSYTFSQNIEMYSKERKASIEKYDLSKNSVVKQDETNIKFANGEKLDLEAAPSGAMLYINLSWMPVESAEGYNVYRSFDSVNYEKYSSVTSSQLQDYSPQVSAGKKVYYRVRPYNDVGEGDYIERKITPLPSYSVMLQSPTNKSSDVSLKPTFEWSYDKSGEFPEDTEFFNSMWIYDGTDYLFGGLVDLSTTSVEYPNKLEPGYVYSWDVFSSHAIRFMDQDENGYSTSYSVAGEYTGDTSGTGSENGEFIFTTTEASTEGSVE